MTVELRDVARFDRVRFRGPGLLKISHDDTESLTVHAPAYLIGDIISEVRGNTLNLGYVSPRVHRLTVHREIISYRLTMRDLRGLTLTGSGRILVPDLDNDVIEVDVAGSGQVVMENLTADRLDVRLRGSGTLVVAGDVEAQSLKLSGSGQYQAERLVSDFADIIVSGSGAAGVAVSDELTVVIDGSGNVTYSGYPEVIKQIRGSGKLVRKRRQPKQGKRGEEHVQ